MRHRTTRAGVKCCVRVGTSRRRAPWSRFGRPTSPAPDALVRPGGLPWSASPRWLRLTVASAFPPLPIRAARISVPRAETAGLDGRAGTLGRRRIRGVGRADDQYLHQSSTIMPPVRGEHMAYGDAGVTIYCTSVRDARSNFEGGPSALAAGLTGFTPCYGYHLDACRRVSLLVEAAGPPSPCKSGYGQVPVPLSMDACLEAACSGRIASPCSSPRQRWEGWSVAKPWWRPTAFPPDMILIVSQEYSPARSTRCSAGLTSAWC
jgi:hypothetical protein